MSSPSWWPWRWRSTCQRAKSCRITDGCCSSSDAAPTLQRFSTFQHHNCDKPHDALLRGSQEPALQTALLPQSCIPLAPWLSPAESRVQPTAAPCFLSGRLFLQLFTGQRRAAVPQAVLLSEVCAASGKNVSSQPLSSSTADHVANTLRVRRSEAFSSDMMKTAEGDGGMKDRLPAVLSTLTTVSLEFSDNHRSNHSL